MFAGCRIYGFDAERAFEILKSHALLWRAARLMEKTVVSMPEEDSVVKNIQIGCSD